MLLIGLMSDWPNDSDIAVGHIVKELGLAGSIEAETEVIKPVLSCTQAM